MCKRFEELSGLVKELQVEQDSLVQRNEHLLWYDKERKKKFDDYEEEVKRYKARVQEKLKQVARDLENAQGEATDAREEVNLSDMKVEQLKEELSALEEAKKKSDRKVQTLIERERQEVSKFMLFERIRMVREFKSGGSVNWNLEELEQKFKEEGYSEPPTGESEDSSESEEEVSSDPKSLGPGGGKAGDDVEGTWDSHDAGGKKTDGKDT